MINNEILDPSDEEYAMLLEGLSAYTDEQLAQMEAAQYELADLQEYYSDFRDFYRDCSVELLGFEPSAMQYDMANCLQHAPQYYMIQAQRGEAKTTITGCYGIWRLIHNPKEQILILSAGGDLASDIMVWCTQILTMMPILAVLNDNPTGTCRRSMEKYDVNLLLKGADKQASISSYGITASLAGKRATFLLADDIESQKNSMTDLMRERLNHLTLDFTSINRKGSICYLGTPQSSNSIYNNLASRGYTIDIWPGRVPTEKEREHYGEHLSAYIEKMYQEYPAMRTGAGLRLDRGHPTDPIMMSEADLCKKELDQGPSYFNLQYMLDTTLLDSERFPLKIKDLMFHDLDPNYAPSVMQWSNHPMHAMAPILGQLAKQKYFRVGAFSDERIPYNTRILAIDPAGGGANGDETGYAVVFSAGGYLFLMEAGGLPGGHSPESYSQAVQLMRKWGIQKTIVEKNFGYGAYAAALEARILEENYNVDKDPTLSPLQKEQAKVGGGIVEIYNTGQKELRIIDGLEPIIAGHKLVVNTSVITENIATTQKYEAANRLTFNMLHQFANITRDKGSLMHEDRLEAVQMAVSELMLEIRMVAEEELEKKTLLDMEKERQDPNSIWHYAHGGIGQGTLDYSQHGTLDRLRRR